MKVVWCWAVLPFIKGSPECAKIYRGGQEPLSSIHKAQGSAGCICIKGHYSLLGIHHLPFLYGSGCRSHRRIFCMSCDGKMALFAWLSKSKKSLENLLGNFFVCVCQSSYRQHNSEGKSSRSKFAESFILFFCLFVLWCRIKSTSRQGKKLRLLRRIYYSFDTKKQQSQHEFIIPVTSRVHQRPAQKLQNNRDLSFKKRTQKTNP